MLGANENANGSQEYLMNIYGLICFVVDHIIYFMFIHSNKINKMVDRAMPFCTQADIVGSNSRLPMVAPPPWILCPHFYYPSILHICSMLWLLWNVFQILPGVRLENYTTSVSYSAAATKKIKSSGAFFLLSILPVQIALVLSKVSH